MLLVDSPVWPGKGRAAGKMWAHLVSDISFDELHEFAARLGMPSWGFDRDHYDIPADLVPEAIALGAVRVGSPELVRRIMGAGLRRRKHEAR